MEYVNLLLVVTVVGAVSLMFLAAIGVFNKEKER
jgi:hypothetical protein